MANFPRCLTNTLSAFLLVTFCIDDLPRVAAQVNLSKLLSDRELEIYANARTVVDMTSDELIRAYPRECADLALDDNQEELPALLWEAAERVKALVRDIPNTTSREQVRRERLRNKLTVDDTSTRTYNYLVLSSMSGPWEEIRTDSKGRPINVFDAQDEFFMTSGFAGLVLFFHPGSVTTCRFRLLGRQRSEPGAYLIAFAQRPDGPAVGSMRTPLMSTSAVSIMYQGLAWVDPRTHQILRMRTELLAPRIDVYLARQTTEIWYAEVRFASSAQTFWLPREVLATFEWRGQVYRNRHLYSDYLVFSVESQDKLVQPKIKK